MKKWIQRLEIKERTLRQGTAALLALLLAAGVLAGCGSSKAEETEVTVSTSETGAEALEEAAEAEEPAEVREIKAAVIGTTNGYAYYDENNELVGYNVDVLNAVFDRLPQYALSFETTEFQSIFTGIDSGIYQIGAQAFISSAERREKYIFTEAFGKYVFKIITRADDTAINSWADLDDKTTESITGDGPVAIIEAYNAEYPDHPIQLNYVETDALVMNHLVDGKIDFYINSATINGLRAEEYGLSDQLRYVDFGEDAPDYFASNQYFGFLISKTDEQLAEDFNEVLEALIEDGTIEELNEKWFGGSEYSVSLEEARAFRDAAE